MYRSLSYVAVAVAALLAGSAWGYQKGAEKRPTYKDAVHGFTVDMPIFPGSGPNVPGTVFSAVGPVQGTFAPNVNVLIQGTKTTAKEYVDLSIGQIRQLGLKLKGQKKKKISGRDAIEIDYQGSLNGGEDLRFLSLSIIDKARVIVLTCTAPPDAFEAGEAEYRACLESFKLE